MAILLVAAPAVLMGIAALWAIGAVRRPPRLDRPDRGTALKLLVVLGALPGVGYAAYAVLIGLSFGGSITVTSIGFTIAMGAGVFLAIFLTGLAGYALLARPAVGRAALIGVLAGPLLLGGSTALGARLGVIIGGDDYESNQREAERIASLISISATDVRPLTFVDPTTGQEIVEGLSLTIVVRAEEAVMLSMAAAHVHPDGAEASGWGAGLSSAPLLLPVGETRFAFEERWPDRAELLGFPTPPQTGPWILQFTFILPDFRDPMKKEVSFDVPGGAG